ncbi:MAG: HAD family hydrolase [Phycisphaerales bacterium]|nr:HAD family hydrolase [Phycisphaerales bacterium]
MSGISRRRAHSAIIFDCDGVLVDSEPLANRVMSELLAEHGVAMTPEECLRRFVGMTIPAEAAAIREDFGVDLLDVLQRVLTARTLARFERELRAMDGAAEALGRCRRPIGVASNSVTARVRLSLRVTGLERFFADHVYTAEMVARPKPAPDLYLHAAARLGFPPAECLVVEDSVSGTSAARAAGIAVIGFTGGGHAGDGLGRRLLDAGAVEVMASWRELDSLVAG